MSPYIHELSDWPEFRWDQEKLVGPLAAVRHRQGRLLGRMETLGFSLRAEATLQTLTLDVLKSSEIEGEILDHDQVRSSVARRLGIDIGALAPADRNVEGVVEMMLDATQNYSAPLTDERLFRWHASLFPAGHTGMGKIAVGRSVAEDLAEIAFDPQTSGGLLIALPKKDAPRLVKALRAARISAATVVGTATRLRHASVELV